MCTAVPDKRRIVRNHARSLWFLGLVSYFELCEILVNVYNASSKVLAFVAWINSVDGGFYELIGIERGPTEAGLWVVKVCLEGKALVLCKSDSGSPGKMRWKEKCENENRLHGNAKMWNKVEVRRMNLENLLVENARGLPTFRSTGDNGTKDPVEHMLCCKTIFIANYYRPQYWLTALLTTLRTVYINWATKKLVEAVPSLMWEKTTDIFV